MKLSDTVDTSQTSLYITPEYYERALKDLEKFEDEFIPVSLELKDKIERLIFTEARYLDELRLEEWLALYSKECLYWIPTIPGGGDPRKEVSIAFDDRRRLEDRVYRIRTGFAYSQLPLSRTRRMITNVEVSKGESENELFVRSNFILYEFRVGILRSFAGWTGYKLNMEDNDWKVNMKMTNLIDSDQAHENLTFIL